MPTVLINDVLSVIWIYKQGLEQIEQMQWFEQMQRREQVLRELLMTVPLFRFQCHICQADFFSSTYCICADCEGRICHNCCRGQILR